MQTRKPYLAITVFAVLGAFLCILGLAMIDFRRVRGFATALAPMLLGGYLLVWAYNLATDNGKF